MLRISITRTALPSATLHLEGQIAGAWTTELERACREVLLEAPNVTLDLADVTMIDREGIALLMKLTSKGVELANCSPFQEEQIRLAAIPNRDITSVLR